MRPLALVFVLFIANNTIMLAQSPSAAKTTADSLRLLIRRVNDSTITATILDSGISAARKRRELPDWVALKQVVTENYDSIYAERTVSKAIAYYYYYARDWAKFSTAFIYFESNFVTLDNPDHLSSNAHLILLHSKNPAEWRIALAWVTQALKKDKYNDAYQQVYDGLMKKLNSQ